MEDRFASVDIGSNTIKVTICDYLGDNKFKKRLYKDFPSGLSSNTSKTDLIDVSKLADCYKALNEIRVIIEENKVDKYKYIATHALREAVNQKEILGLIKSNTGVEVEVITGEEEAELTLTAILVDFPSGGNYACINAGGGSTELSFYTPDLSKRNWLYSFRFGAVNLYEDYLKDKADVETAVRDIHNLINDEFKKITIPSAVIIDKVISVGGSIYNAAYILKKDVERNFDLLQGMKISTRELESVIDELKKATAAERSNIPGMDKQRTDSTLPGILIHYFLLKHLIKNELFISTRTIGEGLIYKMAKR